MAKLINAHTNPGSQYPGYVNFTREDDGTVSITVRGDPVRFDGVYVCGYAVDRGKPGRCTPGDAACNNYCNMAPDKGPMAPAPLACNHVREGVTAKLTLSAGAAAAFLAGLDAVRSSAAMRWLANFRRGRNARYQRAEWIRTAHLAPPGQPPAPARLPASQDIPNGGCACTSLDRAHCREPKCPVATPPRLPSDPCGCSIACCLGKDNCRHGPEFAAKQRRRRVGRWL